MEKVLMIISPENIITHVGDPEGFTNTTLYSYIMDGYTITTITIDEFRIEGFRLYEEVTISIKKQ